MAADQYGIEGVEKLPIVAENGADSAVGSEAARFKAIDVGIIQYLKLVHTELYEKLQAAVRSIMK